jgi:hypothetical protein
MPVIPATREAEWGGLLFEARPRQKVCKTPPQPTKVGWWSIPAFPTTR